MTQMEKGAKEVRHPIQGCVKRLIGKCLRRDIMGSGYNNIIGGISYTVYASSQMVKGAPHTGEKIEQHSGERALSRISCNATLQAHRVDEVQGSSQSVLLSPR